MRFQPIFRYQEQQASGKIRAEPSCRQQQGQQRRKRAPRLAGIARLRAAGVRRHGRGQRDLHRVGDQG
jgi:hypothetical protein